MPEPVEGSYFLVGLTRAAPMFMVVEVLPTPPFWLAVQ
jgi:hypothetical protein